MLTVNKPITDTVPVSPQWASQAWHALPAAAAAEVLSSDLTAGLIQAEAQQRLKTVGPNRLREEKHEPFWAEFLEELREPLILLLLGTGVLYAIWGELIDAATIFVVILTLNMIEVVNEQRAKKAIFALRKLAEPIALVLREGRSQEAPVEQLVPGDVILLQAGRRVPAEARLVESYGLTVDESSLTGESVPVNKEAGLSLSEDTSLAERANLVFSGTLVTLLPPLWIALKTGPLSLEQWLLILALTAAGTFWLELRKLVTLNYRRQ